MTSSGRSAPRARRSRDRVSARRAASAWRSPSRVPGTRSDFRPLFDCKRLPDSKSGPAVTAASTVAHGQVSCVVATMRCVESVTDTLFTRRRNNNRLRTLHPVPRAGMMQSGVFAARSLRCESVLLFGRKSNHLPLGRPQFSWGLASSPHTNDNVGLLRQNPTEHTPQITDQSPVCIRIIMPIIS